MPLHLLGIDPGFASCGWCRLIVAAEPGVLPVVEEAGVVRTKANAKKLRIRALEDNLQRISEISDALWQATRHGTPGSSQVVAIEGYSGMRFAAAALKLGLAWGACVATMRRHGAPLLEYTRLDTYKALGLGKKASKEEVVEVVLSRVQGLKPFLDAHPVGEHEHMADAAAVALAAIQSDVVRAARLIAGGTVGG